MKPSLKTTGMLIFIAALSGLFATQANALTIGDSNYIGQVVDGIPSGPVDEAGYINSLLALAPGAEATTCGDETCDRIGSSLDTDGFVDAVADGSAKNESGASTGIDVTDWTYLIAKYDAAAAGSLVWYVGDLNEIVSIPPQLNNFDVSHYTLFNNVPEPTPLVLLGVGFLGLGFMRVMKRT